MAKIVPVVQLAAHAKIITLYGRSYGRTSKFFRLDGLLLFRIIMGYAVRASRAAISAITKHVFFCYYHWFVFSLFLIRCFPDKFQFTFCIFRVIDSFQLEGKM